MQTLLMEVTPDCGCGEAQLPVSLVQNEHVSFQHFETKLVIHPEGSGKKKKKELYVLYCKMQICSVII